MTRPNQRMLENAKAILTVRLIRFFDEAAREEVAVKSAWIEAPRDIGADGPIASIFVRFGWRSVFSPGRLRAVHCSSITDAMDKLDEQTSSVTTRERTIEIANVSVHPRFRKHGIMLHVFEICKRIAARKGVRVIYVENAVSPEMIAWCDHRGFTRIDGAKIGGTSLSHPSFYYLLKGDTHGPQSTEAGSSGVSGQNDRQNGR